MSRARILVVDDSAFARKVLREVLQRAPDLEVVGTAHDGLDALAKIEALDPDVITLDLMMPHLNGVETLRALSGRIRPRAVVVCSAGADSDLAMSALAAGAVDIVEKPTSLATDRLYDLSHELLFKVRSAAAARGSAPVASAEVLTPPPARAYRGAFDLLAIGASTGGPHAVGRILRALPSDFPIPVAVVIHLPSGFTESYAQRLNDECAVQVHEASSGIPLQPGTVLIAPGGRHLTVQRQAGSLFAFTGTEPRSLHCPSVDQLFTSAASAAAERVLGVVLTGMGDDGLRGSQALHEAGACVLAESEETCVVYGMPRVVWEAKLAAAQHPLHGMAAAILERV